MWNSRMNRRDFLKASAALAAGAGLVEDAIHTGGDGFDDGLGAFVAGRGHTVTVDDGPGLGGQHRQDLRSPKINADEKLFLRHQHHP